MMRAIIVVSTTVMQITKSVGLHHTHFWAGQPRWRSLMKRWRSAHLGNNRKSPLALPKKKVVLCWASISHRWQLSKLLFLSLCTFVFRLYQSLRGTPANYADILSSVKSPRLSLLCLPVWVVLIYFWSYLTPVSLHHLWEIINMAKNFHLAEIFHVLLWFRSFDLARIWVNTVDLL